MNEISVDNGSIRQRHSVTEQHPHIDDSQPENPTQNQFYAAESADVTEKKKESPTTPTALYIILFSSQSLS